MKRILMAMVLCLVCTLGLVSCDKQPDKTRILTQEKGWVLYEAYCPNGLVMNNDVVITDLMYGPDSYLLDCEIDDIIKFNADGYEYMNPGKNLCDYQASQEHSIGRWALDDGVTLDMQIPFFYDDKVESCTLFSLTEHELQVQYVYTHRGSPAKVKPGKYIFILTYIPAK